MTTKSQLLLDGDLSWNFFIMLDTGKTLGGANHTIADMPNLADMQTGCAIELLADMF